MPHHHEHLLPPGIDPDLAAILPVIAGPGGEFGHREHIHLAFWAVRRSGMPVATVTICTWLRQLTEYHVSGVHPAPPHPTPPTPSTTAAHALSFRPHP
jgi:hypothetical protein